MQPPGTPSGAAAGPVEPSRPAAAPDDPPAPAGEPGRQPVRLALASSTALAVWVSRPEEVAGAVRDLGLVDPRPVLVVVGGASGLAARRLNRLRPLFGDALVPVVRSVGGAVVDGGTDAGVMRLVGEVAATGPTFPLLGVAAVGTVAIPGELDLAGAALESHHTHFILVPGSAWGDESEWISTVAAAVAGPRPSVTVLVNGGETAWRDVEASLAVGRPVVVVDGSGRAADDIAAALGGAPFGDRGYRLAASGLVEAVSLDGGAGELAEAVRRLLGG
jgi:hypothetical protein